MKRFFMLVALCVFLISNARPATAQTKDTFFIQRWEMDDFENPESIVIDEKRQVLYVSNINGAMTEKDGNGYISKVSLGGTLVSKKWIQGLNAPKGLAIYKNHLYVADIDEIVDIDMEKEAIIARFKVEKATFLNDIAVDKQGRVFVSNTFGLGCIFKLENNAVDVWFESENLPMPNGLLAVKDGLLVASYGAGLDPIDFSTKTLGSVYKIHYATQNFESLTQPFGNLDGIASTTHGYLITDWLAGRLFFLLGNRVEQMLQLSSGTADLAFDKPSHTMFIPMMNEGRVIAYTVKIKE